MHQYIIVALNYYTMKKYLFAPIFCCLLASCASILNKKELNVYVYTANPAKIVYESDTIQTSRFEELNTAKLVVPRSKDSLQFVLINDSINRKVSISSSISFLYYMNIISPLSWPGFLIERSNPKRYMYKNILSFDSNLSLSLVSNVNSDATEKQKAKIIRQRSNTYKTIKKDRFLTQKGDIYLNLNFPHVNYFRISPDYEDDKDYFGFFGIGLGLDYYYNKNHFLNLSVSGTMDFLVPVPAPVDYEGEYTSTSSFDVTLSHNHRTNRISYGYGLSYARNLWRYNNDDIELEYSRYNSALGLAFKGQYYFLEKFTVGLIYRPTFVRLNSISNKNLKYEHYLGLDFAFKFRLSNRK